MNLEFKLGIVISLFNLGDGTLSNIQDEPGFTQCLVHPLVNEDSECDPDHPFVPFPIVVHPSPAIKPTNSDCECGVHDFIGDDLSSISNIKSVKSDRSPQSKNYSMAEEYVVPGDITDQNQFPFIVALIERKSDGSATHFCGGTLITSKLIVTATHCLVGKSADSTEIWLNERDLLLTTETDHPTLKMKVVKFIVHPEYNPLMNYNDISLIELSEPVDIAQTYLRPICLPPNSTYEPTDFISRGYTAGWGQTKFNGPKSDRLRHVAVPLITNKACNEESEPYYKGRVTTHMICAGDLKQGGTDACPGDSGGPLFIKHENRFRLIGIVSWGARCAEPRRPGVYTRLSQYLRWILKVHAEMEQSIQCEDFKLN